MKLGASIPESHLFWIQKVKDKGHEAQKHCRRGFVHSCECWLLPVVCITIANIAHNDCISSYYSKFSLALFSNVQPVSASGNEFH